MNISDIQQKIDSLGAEVHQLEIEVTKSEVVKDKTKIKTYSNNLSILNSKLDIYNQLLKIEQTISENKKHLKNEKDPELSALFEQETKDLEEKEKNLQKELYEIENPANSGENADSCFLEIRAGTGGDEASLFVYDLFRMYSHYAESKGWQISILNEHKTGSGGFKEIIAELSGKGCYTALQFENGVHRVQRIPATESSGRIHTSAVSVVLYPMVAESEVEINPNEIRIDVYRSTGPGGQSVNTTDSAVRIFHIPTGITVTCQDEKSQHKNKARAMKALKSKLMDLQKQAQDEKVSQIRKDSIKSGDRSAKIRTYNFPQSRITDHRIKKSWHNLKQILDGDMETMVQETAEGMKTNDTMVQ